mmetsp:Transcript_12828/g.38191  ORF Transcript_12828/g.38191 Transcript_12828/m.38191 type:complete len:356 (+) Transcript_12828:1-1068(+)
MESATRFRPYTPLSFTRASLWGRFVPKASQLAARINGSGPSDATNAAVLPPRVPCSTRAEQHTGLRPAEIWRAGRARPAHIVRRRQPGRRALLRQRGRGARGPRRRRRLRAGPARVHRRRRPAAAELVPRRSIVGAGPAARLLLRRGADSARAKSHRGRGRRVRGTEARPGGRGPLHRRLLRPQGPRGGGRPGQNRVRFALPGKQPGGPRLPVRRQNRPVAPGAADRGGGGPRRGGRGPAADGPAEAGPAGHRRDRGHGRRLGALHRRGHVRLRERLHHGRPVPRRDARALRALRGPLAGPPRRLRRPAGQVVPRAFARRGPRAAERRARVRGPRRAPCLRHAAGVAGRGPRQGR